jgi:predicted small integral membrane protein
MPRDELGLDPYQRAAIRCARQGVCACCLCLLGACLVFAHRYAKPGSNEWVTRTAVDATTGDHLFYFGCFAVACAALICLMVRNKLVVEDLTWRDII